MQVGTSVNFRDVAYRCVKCSIEVEASTFWPGIKFLNKLKYRILKKIKSPLDVATRDYLGLLVLR